MAFKMKGHTLPGIKQLKSNDLDDGRSGSAAFQQSDDHEIVHDKKDPKPPIINSPVPTLGHLVISDTPEIPDTPDRPERTSDTIIPKIKTPEIGKMITFPKINVKPPELKNMLSE